ncbi:ArsA family ATPase [Streptomyces sp. P38-E01]|uniref:ArsA family ATPase n=1 Tax=Streptomyces tardus TaxID=2780544 RepID=A0A949JG98_9ACTN|nr:ArsA family ATPase [Streptomyces tardus]
MGPDAAQDAEARDAASRGAGADADGAGGGRGGVRVRFVTGAGGAGRTTVAAALARAGGVRTALITTEPAVLSASAGHSVPAGQPPVEVIAVDVVADFRDRVADLQRGGGELLDQFGAQPLESDEVTELPGATALAVLRALREAVAAGHRRIVVDLPPAAEAVRLLLLPAQLDRYLGRLMPAERQAARALRPMLAQLAGVPMPARQLYEVGERMRAECTALAELVESVGSTAVLVVEPGGSTERTVAETRAGMALAGVPVTALIANRMVPDGGDAWQTGWAAEQRAVCEELAEAAGPVPVVELPHLGGRSDPTEQLAAVLAAADLDAADDDAADAGTANPGASGTEEGAGAAGVAAGPSEAGGAADPGAADAGRPRDASSGVRRRVEDRLSEEGELVWWLPLPGAQKERLAVVRRGDEAIVTVGPYRRALPLPPALRRCTVAGARLTEGELAVRFRPDPALWPRSR